MLVRGGMGVQFSSRFEAEHETGLVFRRIAPWVYTDDAITSKKLRWRLDPNSVQNVPIVQFKTTHQPSETHRILGQFLPP